MFCASSTAGSVRAFVANLKLNQMFTTRDLLGFGGRGAIDQEIHMLVKKKVIVRLVRGVFILRGSQVPTRRAVAEIKAASFGKRLFVHGVDAGRSLGFPVFPNNGRMFVVDGRSSSFHYRGEEIKLVGRSPRKLVFHNALAGDVVRAMWETGKDTLTDEVIDRTIKNWSAARFQLKSVACYLPEWISARFSWGRERQRPRRESRQQLGQAIADKGKKRERNRSDERFNFIEELRSYRAEIDRTFGITSEGQDDSS